MDTELASSSRKHGTENPKFRKNLYFVREIKKKNIHDELARFSASRIDFVLLLLFNLVHYSFESNMSAVAQIAAKLHSVDEQRELFLWKYRDVKREDVNELMKVNFAVLIVFQMK